MNLSIEPFKEDLSSSEDSGDEGVDTPDEGGSSPKIPHGSVCSVKEFEARYNLKGEQIVKAVAAKESVDNDDGDYKYAIRSYKYFDRQGELYNNYHEISSPHIQKALREVIKEYPHTSLKGNLIVLKGKLKCIFHYRKELLEYCQKQESVAQLHIKLCLRVMEKELARSIRAYTPQVETVTSNHSIEFTDLWMIFKPGELVAAGRNEKAQLLKLVYMSLESGCGMAPEWHIYAKYATHDGKSFGYAEKEFKISEFDGFKEIRQLSIAPLRFLDKQETRKENMRIRGEKFVKFVGKHHRTYNGIATALGKERDLDQWGDPDLFPLETLMVNGRIMLDCKTFGIVKSPNRVTLKTHLTEATSSINDGKALPDEDLIICDYSIPGLSLYDKRWCLFSVDLIKEVEFNDEAFGSLLLPAAQKSIVHALVKNHGSSNDSFDDMIKGKGKGLIFVLHGVPGVGKTFTAESIADHVRRPLYILSSGELGISPESVEANLSNALMLATTWDAILLIDEADVFLEQRTTSDLARNCLVSIFLRTLEYYQGILFLTTNRITTFDPAFKSRIHLALKYSKLSQSNRQELWRMFLARTTTTTTTQNNNDNDKDPSSSVVELDESVLKKLAEVDINGRQIKNAVRTADILARSEGVPLGERHLSVVLETLRDFERDLSEVGDV